MMAGSLEMFGKTSNSLGYVYIGHHPHHPIINTLIANVKLGSLARMEQIVCHIAKLQQESGHYVELQLLHNCFNNDIIKLLCKLPTLLGSLKYLGLGYNGITANGIVTLLSNFIPINGIKTRNPNGTFKKMIPCKLCRLTLGGNKIGNEGAFLLAQFLESPNCHLVSLDIYGCGFTEVGRQALTTANLKRKNPVQFDFTSIYCDTSDDDSSDKEDSDEEHGDKEDGTKENMDVSEETHLFCDTSDEGDSDNNISDYDDNEMF